MQAPSAPAPSVMSGRPKNCIKRRNRRKNSKINRKTHHQPKHQQQYSSPSLQNFQHTNSGLDLWRQTYVRQTTNIRIWQAEHQVNFWKGIACNYQLENEHLKEKLQKYEKKNHQHANVVQTAAPTSSSEETDDTVNEQFLKFMEITERHRVDLKEQRTKSSSSEVNNIAGPSCSTSGL